MRPQYRFTLDNSKVISEPVGWNQMIVELNRDKKYWSLVESIEIPLMFYGNSADGDGGYDYLKAARSNGPDTQVEILVEISWDVGVTFETFFEGLLDFTEMIDMETDRKFQCTTLRTSAWSRFVNRGSVPVDVSVTAIEHTLTLPSQEVRQLYIGIHSDDISYTIVPEGWGIIDWKIVNRNEIKKKSNLPRVSSITLPVELFELEYAGYYTFTGDVYISNSASFPTSQITDVQVQIQINNNAPIAWTMEQLGTNGVDGRTHFYYDALHSLQKGDQVRIYFYNTNVGSAKTFVWSDFNLQGLSVVADTIFPASSSESYFIHDVGSAIVREITAQEYFYSDYFGGLGTKQIQVSISLGGGGGVATATRPYTVDGCGVYYRLMKGRHIRGASIAVKNFSQSWDEWWDGVDPIFMLGAGYETLVFSNGGSNYDVEMLNVGPREMFFDATAPSITLEQYDMDFKLQVSYDVEFLLTSIKHGYKKWQSQSASGNDDPQTQHTRATRFKTVGSLGAKDIEFLSSFVAASLTIEQGRRLSEVLSQDWPLDEDTFIIQANSSLSPDEVRLYSNDVVTGIENADTRYNLRLTPVSNFNRWIRWLSIGFQDYIGDLFTFVDGEGNTEMVFDNPLASGCDAEPGTFADESGDIEIEEGIMTPLLYKFSVPFTWENYKSVRGNRRKAIQLNYRNNVGETVSVVLFIRSLKYDPSKSEADFECWFKGVVQTEFDIAIEGELDESVGTPDWSIIVNNDTGHIMTFLGSGTDSDTMTIGQNSANAQVFKNSNSGIAEAAGSIRWLKNGSVVNTRTFSNLEDVSESTYVFTDVEDGDLLRVEIYEGTTP